MIDGDVRAGDGKGVWVEMGDGGWKEIFGSLIFLPFPFLGFGSRPFAGVQEWQ